MTTIRVEKNKDNPYVMINKITAQDDRLSWKAKGILTYLLSLPDDWVIYVNELTKHAPDGEASLRSGLKELEAIGYIQKEQTRNEDGTFGDYNYIVKELPIQPLGDFPHADKPDAVKPDADNRALLSNNKTNNDNTNIKREGASQKFDHLLELIERYTGVMQTQQDIKAIQEMVSLNVMEEDIASAVKFFADQGRAARGAAHLMNSIRYNMQKRVQQNATKDVKVTTTNGRKRNMSVLDEMKD